MDFQKILDTYSLGDFPAGLTGCRSDGTSHEFCEYDLTVFDERDELDTVIEYGDSFVCIMTPSFRFHNVLQNGLYDKKSPLVGIIMGSKSDARIMIKVAEVLDKFGIKHEDQIVSAHRTPTRLEEYAKHAKKSKFRVIIAGAGGAAHLPGMIASFTNMPVIGVPIMVYNDKQGERHKFSAFGGLDSLVSMSEMPTGSPVACVGVNKAENAGIYAAKILANEFPDIAVKLVKFKNSRHDEVLEE